MSPARFTRTIRLALKSLMLHKLRSGLTMLGIVFGVFSVIAMLAIGEGASAQAQRQVLELGANNIIVRSVKPPEEATNSVDRVLTYGLTRADYDLLIDTIPSLVNAVPIQESMREGRNQGRMMQCRLVGCTMDYLKVNHLELEPAGRFISNSDQESYANVAVIAQEVADVLFPTEDPLNKSIQVGTNYYVVIGVARHRTASVAIGGSLTGQDFNKDVYIPIRTYDLHIGDLDVRRTSGSFTAELVELNQITLMLKDLDGILPTAAIVREVLSVTHEGQSDYAVVVPLELLKQANQIRWIFNIVLGSIAAISLLVGGIGIMNIMLATVTERTREIGIRRALGANQRDITQQFLTETAVLSGTGGLIGMILGLLTPVAFQGVQLIADRFILVGENSSEISRIFADMQPQIAYFSLPLSFCIAVGIGIAFGLYPAQSAARLDPIEALRHE